jgi:hypothetical protein
VGPTILRIRYMFIAMDRWSGCRLPLRSLQISIVISRTGVLTIPGVIAGSIEIALKIFQLYCSNHSEVQLEMG